MTPAWALRQEELLSDCVVSPDVFSHMAGRLGDFVAPYQQALETEAGKRNVPLYLAGLLSHLPCKTSSAPPPGTTSRWSRCWLDKWSSGWENPMASSPLIPAVSPSGARTRWESSGNGVAIGGRSTTARWACTWGTSLATTMRCSTSACPFPTTG